MTPMKPIKAWGIVDEDGQLLRGSQYPFTYMTQRGARSLANVEDGERIARILITEIPRKGAGK